MNISERIEMNILIATPTFIPSRFGGVKEVSYNHSKFLAIRGHNVTVYTTDANIGSRITDLRNHCITGINIRYFRNLSNFLAYKYRLFLPMGLIMSNKSIRDFEIIHIHDYRSFLSIIICYFAMKYRIPYVLQAHGSVLPMFQKKRIKTLFDDIFGYRILRNAAKIIALTDIEARQYKSMGIAEDKIKIVPNGIDLSNYDDLPIKGEFKKKYSIGESDRIVLYLGRLHRLKGINLLIETFSELVKEIGDIRLVIVGPDDGILFNLKKQIDNLNINNKVLLTGPLYGRDKLEAYIDADVYVLPSIYETFPNTVLEAFACGIPVIVTDRCGISHIVNKAGFVIEYNKDHLGKAIMKILNDAKLSAECGDASKRMVKDKYTWDNIIIELEDVYQDILAGGV